MPMLQVMGIAASTALPGMCFGRVYAFKRRNTLSGSRGNSTPQKRAIRLAKGSAEPTPCASRALPLQYELIRMLAGTAA